MKYGYTACELGETFVELLLVVVTCGSLNLSLNLGYTRCDSLFRALNR